jgi:NAD(P)H-nitrite reductase large subunit
MKKVVCICEDVTEEEMVQAIRAGYDNIELLKRYTGASTGPCQGKNCLMHMIKILARETGKKIEDIKMPTQRQPLMPVRLSVLAGEKNAR